MTHPLRAVLAAGMCIGLIGSVGAHDTWLEVSPRLVRPDDVVHVGLFLGNHGNDHRDFKIAGKVGSLDGVRIDVVGPTGHTTDLVPEMFDMGYAPNEGWWSGRFVPAAEGLHCVSHFRQGIRHGTMGYKGGKTYFLCAESLDRQARPRGPLPDPLGHPLEFVLESHPVLGCGPGQPIAIRLLFKGRPLAEHRVSFIPRGTTLADGFDAAYERTTDAEGRCRYALREGNVVLVVAHVVKPDEAGEGFEKTAYAATLVLDVPQRCPCCE